MAYGIMVSEVAFDALSVGDRCISVKDTPGKITALRRADPGLNREDSVAIDWDNGNKTYQWHSNLCAVTYIGK